MLRMIVVVLKLSLLVVVGMCKSASSSIRHRSDPTPWISTDSLFNAFPYRENDKELRPLTIIVSKFGYIGQIAEDILSKDEITKIDHYLITHPVVNKKLLQAYLDGRLDIDSHFVKVFTGRETKLEMAELVTKKLLKFVDTLFEELDEQLPLTKKEKLKNKAMALIEELKQMVLGMNVKATRLDFTLPRFMEEFFETSDIGLTEKEFSEISKNLYYIPHNDPVKRKIYNYILDDRLYFDNLLQKIGKTGLRKQENRRKLKQLRIKTIKSISNALSYPGLQPKMKKYAIKIQKHVSQNVN